MSIGTLLACGGQALKILARPVSTVATLWKINVTATLSVARDCASLIGSGLAKDVGRVAEAKIRQIEAEAEMKSADARRRLAEAMEVVDRSQIARRQELIAKREDELSRAVIRKENAQSLKVEEEVRAIKLENEYKEVLIETTKRSLEGAIRRLQAEGGQVIVNRRNLSEYERLALALLEEVAPTALAGPPESPEAHPTPLASETQVRQESPVVGGSTTKEKG